MRPEVVTFIEAQYRREQAVSAEAEASCELALADDAFEVAWEALTPGERDAVNDACRSLTAAKAQIQETEDHRA